MREDNAKVSKLRKAVKVIAWAIALIVAALATTTTVYLLNHKKTHDDCMADMSKHVILPEARDYCHWLTRACSSYHDKRCVLQFECEHHYEKKRGTNHPGVEYCEYARSECFEDQFFSLGFFGLSAPAGDPPTCEQEARRKYDEYRRRRR